jgi:SAM-dependent methyltransferase
MSHLSRAMNALKRRMARGITRSLMACPFFSGTREGRRNICTRAGGRWLASTLSKQRFKDACVLCFCGSSRLAETTEAKHRETRFIKQSPSQPADALCLSIGGGPSRGHPSLINLNVGLFANVDVVADAYELPYTAGSVDAVCCEAVLEHLEFPERSVAEMWRVLEPGGQVFAATPFLQLYHGYPDHYQNFTLTGHQRLFERAGFSIISFGACVGPTFALTQLCMAYARYYTPTNALKYVAAGLAVMIALPLRPLDYLINKAPAAHILASTTYVHAVKPPI